MAKLDKLCKRVYDEIDGSIAVGVVDVSSGTIIGIHHTIPSFTKEFQEVVAASAVELFKGRKVKKIEKLLSKSKGIELKNTFKEVFLNYGDIFHFMKVVEGKEACVVMVTNKTTNQGMCWSRLKIVIPEIRDLLP